VGSVWAERRCKLTAFEATRAERRLKLPKLCLASKAPAGTSGIVASPMPVFSTCSNGNNFFEALQRSSLLELASSQRAGFAASTAFNMAGLGLRSCCKFPEHSSRHSATIKSTLMIEREDMSQRATRPAAIQPVNS
jgi:hypothetical protein